MCETHNVYFTLHCSNLCMCGVCSARRPRRHDLGATATKEDFAQGAKRNDNTCTRLQPPSNPGICSGPDRCCQRMHQLTGMFFPKTQQLHATTRKVIARVQLDLGRESRAMLPPTQTRALNVAYRSQGRLRKQIAVDQTRRFSRGTTSIGAEDKNRCFHRRRPPTNAKAVNVVTCIM
jgi:hypothetical protein